MTAVSFSYYQVITVVLFLLILGLAHFYIRKNRGLLSGKLGTAKHMQILEDLSVSPSERMRLIKIGSEFIFVASSKGSSPTVQLLNGITQIRNKTDIKKSHKLSSPNHLSNDVKVKEKRTSLADGNETGKGYGNALKTAIQQARKMNPHVSF